MKLGFIGLGNIGSVMARRLVEQGHALTVHDINPAATQSLAAAGATVATSITDMARTCDTVLLSLPMPDIVRAVANELTNGLTTETRIQHIIDLSTTGASMSATIADDVARQNIAWLDAPVSGGVSGAANGTLAIMVSGPESVYRETELLLRQIGSRIFYLGDKAGQAQTMKVVNNFMAAASIISCCEGLVFGAKAGIDTATMLDVLNASSGRTYATEKRVPDAVLGRRFPTVFTAGLMHKDVKLCLDEAGKMGMPMWMGSAVQQFLAFAVSQGAGNRDLVEVIKCYESLTGVEVN